jgi:hypothetical protein
VVSHLFFYQLMFLGFLWLWVVYLNPAAKYDRLTRRPSQGQKGLDERAIVASQWPSPPW